MSLEYQSEMNFMAKGSDGSIARKVPPSGISQAMNTMRIGNQLKWNS
jgi:hypothetical protein